MPLFRILTLTIAAVWIGLCGGASAGSAADQAAEQEMLQADRAFVTAVAKADKRPWQKSSTRTFPGPTPTEGR